MNRSKIKIVFIMEFNRNYKSKEHLVFDEIKFKLTCSDKVLCN